MIQNKLTDSTYKIIYKLFQIFLFYNTNVFTLPGVRYYTRVTPYNSLGYGYTRTTTPASLVPPFQVPTAPTSPFHIGGAPELHVVSSTWFVVMSNVASGVTLFVLCSHVCICIDQHSNGIHVATQGCMVKHREAIVVFGI